jgi:hypothetical protein
MGKTGLGAAILLTETLLQRYAIEALPGHLRR